MPKPGMHLSTLPLCVLIAFAKDCPASESPSQIAATTVVVSSCADSGPGTVRDLAMHANVTQIDINCSTVTLTTGDIVTPAAGVDVRILGTGAVPTTIHASGKGRIFHQQGVGASLSLDRLYLDSGTAYNTGGCVFSQGLVTLRHTRLTDCAVHGQDAGSNAYGGAVYAQDVRLYGSSITGSSAISQNGAAAGGAIWAKNVYVTSDIDTATREKIAGTGSSLSYDFALSNAAASSRGGAIASSGQAMVSYTTIDHCYGGVVSAVAANSLTIESSTISGNRQSAFGVGAVYGIQLISIQNSTIAFNSGTGLSFAGATLGSNGNLFVLSSSIIASNTNYGGAPADLSSPVAITESPLVSIIGASSPVTPPLPADVIRADPLLDPALQNNGGATLTHLFKTGSPALGKVARSAGFPLDQRGFARPQNHADIGAVEDMLFADGLD